MGGVVAAEGGTDCPQSVSCGAQSTVWGQPRSTLRNADGGIDTAALESVPKQA